MTKRTRTMIFMVSVAIFFALAYMVSSKINKTEEETTADNGKREEKLIEAEADDITKISFSYEGDETVSLERKEDKWVYAADNGYPLDNEKVEKLADTLAELSEIPDYTIVLTYLNSENTQEEQTLTLHIGTTTENGTYMRIGDSDMILSIGSIELDDILQ